MRTRVRPLLARPGARFECAGDGLCCTDAHLLGPLRREEARALAARARPSVARTAGQPYLATQEGRCVWLLGDGRCEVHDSADKPLACRRYPFLLVATPDGGRIATDHRCPCRTMGERPPIDPAVAAAALTGASGRLEADLRAPDVLPIADGRSVGWTEWRAVEADLLGALGAGQRVEAVLGAAPFPALREGRWLDVGRSLAADERPMRWTRAAQWAGDAIAALHGAAVPEGRPRPWKPELDRAEARSAPSDPEAMLADWVADGIWSLEWTGHGDLALARADLATRVAIARWIAARVGGRADRAMAEAIAIVEIVGLSDPWAALLARLSP